MTNEVIKKNIPRIAAHAGLREVPALPGDVCPLHYHDELEFIIVFSGSIVVSVDEAEYTARAGEVIFINSGVPHSTYYTEKSTTGLLQFRENDFLDTDITKVIKYSVKFNNLSDSKLRIISNPELFTAVERVLREFSERDSAYEIYIRSEIYKILACLYRSKILIDTESFFLTKEVQKVLPAIEYVNRNYNEEITLESASAMLGFDQSYFCRIFKAACGATFTEYLNFVRICKAEKMLAHTSDSILTISETVGFSSVSYFNRVFKKYRNCSPRHYRLAEYKNI